MLDKLIEAKQVLEAVSLDPRYAEFNEPLQDSIEDVQMMLDMEIADFKEKARKSAQVGCG